MDNSEFVKPAIGAGLGFVLAQVFNLAKLIHERIMRPKLRIFDPKGRNWQFLMQLVEAEKGKKRIEERRYGFCVCNYGHRIATGVRFQLLKIEYRHEGWAEFHQISGQTFDLFVANESGSDRGANMTTLVPGAVTTVHLASWREDFELVLPETAVMPMGYVEMCQHAVEFRFTVVAFDDQAQFTKSVATIRRETQPINVEGERRSAVARKHPSSADHHIQIEGLS
jgi:hypothetical protein